MKISEIEVGKRFNCTKKTCISQKKQILRAVREDGGTVFVYGYRKRHYGWRYMEADFPKYFDIVVTSVSETEKWHKRIKRALTLMEKNELWLEMKEKVANLLQMSWEDHEAIDNLYWKTSYPRIFNTVEWNEWFQKYPFLAYKDETGMNQVDTFYLWEQSRVILKTMYFGKYKNQTVKDNIKTALLEKSDYSCDARAGYDVSFQYDASKGRAWYSEEYRNCGNGHYYLALSENCAWFCEND